MGSVSHSQLKTKGKKNAHCTAATLALPASPAARRRARILLRHPLLPGLLCFTLGCSSSPQSSQALCLGGQQRVESLKSPPGPGKHGVYASLVSQPPGTIELGPGKLSHFRRKRNLSEFTSLCSFGSAAAGGTGAGWPTKAGSAVTADYALGRTVLPPLRLACPVGFCGQRGGCRVENHLGPSSSNPLLREAAGG